VKQEGHDKVRTNCNNCGAVLHNDRCEYCGTNYGPKPLVVKVTTDGSEAQKPRMKQDEYDKITREFQEYMISRGGLYGTVIQSAYNQILSRYDLTGIKR